MSLYTLRGYCIILTHFFSLNYAIANRYEWETRGREIVNEMVEQLGQDVVQASKKKSMLFL